MALLRISLLRSSALLLASAWIMVGCSTLPAELTQACSSAARPVIEVSTDGRTARTHIDVLSYNIEGLGWPARSGRKAELMEIGRRLRALREAGTAPDVVLFQEAFSGSAVAAVESTDYPSLTGGPGRRARRQLPAAGSTPGPRQLRKGEVGFHLASGGLAIASVYPILERVDEPFSRRGCAGLDCLSNKGALFARIAVPGAPAPVDIFNAHMNSKRASRASTDRTLAAHAIQAEELVAFVAETGTPGNPKILGGDFNMRGSEARFEAFDALLPMQLVHRRCVERPDECRVDISWDGDAPWMDTQDLQLFENGRVMSVRPVRVEAMFDGRPDSPKLSDHDGLRVRYELSWRLVENGGTPVDPCG